MPAIEDILSKREQIISLATQYKTYNVKLFGSVLRGEKNPSSDIDFLVEPWGGKPWNTYCAF